MMRRFCFEINMVACWFGIEESQTDILAERVSLRTEPAKESGIPLVASTHCTKPTQAISATSIQTSCPNAIEDGLQQRLGAPE